MATAPIVPDNGKVPAKSKKGKDKKDGLDDLKQELDMVSILYFFFSLDCANAKQAFASHRDRLERLFFAHILLYEWHYIGITNFLGSETNAAQVLAHEVLIWG